MTPVRAYLHTTIAAMAIAFGVLSAPANATVSTPFGSINAGGFGISTPFGGVSTPFFGLNEQQALSVRTPFGGFSGPGFGLWGNVFGISTPFGGVSTPFFGLGNAGPGAGGYYTGLGLNEQQALSVRTPWGGVSMPGFGIGMPCGFVGPCTPSPLGFGVGGAQQALSVSTPFGGFSGPGFGLMPFLPPGFGVGNAGPGAGGNYTGFGLPTGGVVFGLSTPWGGMNMGGFGIGGQQPQVMPIYLPNPY